MTQRFVSFEQWLELQDADWLDDQENQSALQAQYDREREAAMKAFDDWNNAVKEYEDKGPL